MSLLLRERDTKLTNKDCSTKKRPCFLFWSIIVLLVKEGILELTGDKTEFLPRMLCIKSFHCPPCSVCCINSPCAKAQYSDVRPTKKPKIIYFCAIKCVPFLDNHQFKLPVQFQSRCRETWCFQRCWATPYTWASFPFTCHRWHLGPCALHAG